MQLPENIEFVDVKLSEGWTTQVDTPDLPERYLMDIVGLRNIAKGVIGQLDWGTQRLYANMPTVPNTVTVQGGWKFIDRTNSTEYDVIVCRDVWPFFRIYVRDASMAGANPGTVNDWIELTRVLTAKVNEPVSIGASDVTVDIDTGKDSHQAVYAIGASEVQYWSCINATRSPDQVVFIKSNTTTAITVDNILGSNGLNWVDNDDLIFFKHNGWFDALFRAAFTSPVDVSQINVDLGATPHLSWNPIDAQRKLNLYYGSAPYAVSLKTPIQIQRQSARNFLYTNPGYLIALPANWYLEKGGGGLCPSFVSDGTADAPLVPSGTNVIDIVDAAGNPFFRFGSERTEIAISNSIVQVRIAYTVIYNGYEESDPVVKIYLKSSGPTMSPRMRAFYNAVNFARMNKSITGLRVYMACATQGQIDAGWADADADYIYIRQFTFSGGTDTVWQIDPLISYPEFPYVPNPNDPVTTPALVFDPAAWATAKAKGNRTLQAALAHATQTVRAYRKPRYARQLSRNQTSIIVADDSDLALVTSSYNGDPNHEDDNFPNTAIDIKNQPMHYVLTGHGEIYGLETIGENAVILRPTELEIIGLESGARRILNADVESRRGIIRFPGGIAYAGRASIYLLPEHGGQVENLIPDIQNWYDGSLIATGTTPFVADADRKNIIAGYDLTFEELWFQIKTTNEAGATEWVQLRIPKPENGKPFKRIIDTANSGELTYFANSLDKSFTLGHATGILKYPYRGTLYYQDDVNVDNTTNNRGILGRLALNIASLYDLMQNAVLFCIVLDYEGDDTNGTEKFDLKLYANGSATAFDSKKYYVKKVKSTPDEPRGIEPYGQIQQLKIETLLPVATKQNVKKFNLSTIKLGFLRQTRIGSN